MAARVAKRKATKQLRESVCAANIALFERGLAKFTFGNARGVDREQGLIVIKPSGVSYDVLTPAMLVVTDLDGTVVEGSLRPSSDLPTHAALFRAWESIGGIVHTHSMYATVFAQARRDIPCLGTTHADYFYGAIPCTKPLTAAQVRGGYELETGHAIVRRLRGTDPLMMPVALVANHAPFCWGRTVEAAVDFASYLEEVATMAHHTLTLAPKAASVGRDLLDKHYLRKHGRGAYYGQSK
jgi:L-ribulose-5-phosphate 4-epimerase